MQRTSQHIDNNALENVILNWNDTFEIIENRHTDWFVGSFIENWHGLVCRILSRRSVGVWFSGYRGTDDERK